MPRQRGVKKLANRQAGPYIVMPQYPDITSERARAFLVQRKCTYAGQGAPHHAAQTVYRRKGSTFAECIQMARAFFYVERKELARKNGMHYTCITLSDNANCYQSHMLVDYYRRGFDERLGNRRGNWEYLYEALREMSGEGEIDAACDE